MNAKQTLELIKTKGAYEWYSDWPETYGDPKQEALKMARRKSLDEWALGQIQQAREFANDFLDWDGEVEPHRTRMQLADMARRLLDLPCAKGAEGQGEMTWRNR